MNALCVVGYYACLIIYPFVALSPVSPGKCHVTAGWPDAESVECGKSHGKDKELELRSVDLGQAQWAMMMMMNDEDEKEGAACPCLPHIPHGYNTECIVLCMAQGGK